MPDESKPESSPPETAASDRDRKAEAYGIEL